MKRVEGRRQINVLDLWISSTSLVPNVLLSDALGMDPMEAGQGVRISDGWILPTLRSSSVPDEVPDPWSWDFEAPMSFEWLIPMSLNTFKPPITIPDVVDEVQVTVLDRGDFRPSVETPVGVFPMDDSAKGVYGGMEGDLMNLIVFPARAVVGWSGDERSEVVNIDEVRVPSGIRSAESDAQLKKETGSFPTDNESMLKVLSVLETEDALVAFPLRPTIPMMIGEQDGDWPVPIVNAPPTGLSLKVSAMNDMVIPSAVAPVIMVSQWLTVASSTVIAASDARRRGPPSLHTLLGHRPELTLLLAPIPKMTLPSPRRIAFVPDTLFEPFDKGDEEIRAVAMGVSKSLLAVVNDRRNWEESHHGQGPGTSSSSSSSLSFRSEGVSSTQDAVFSHGNYFQDPSESVSSPYWANDAPSGFEHGREQERQQQGPGGGTHTLYVPDRVFIPEWVRGGVTAAMGEGHTLVSMGWDRAVTAWPAWAPIAALWSYQLLFRSGMAANEWSPVAPRVMWLIPDAVSAGWVVPYLRAWFAAAASSPKFNMNASAASTHSALPTSPATAPHLLLLSLDLLSSWNGAREMLQAYKFIVVADYENRHAAKLTKALGGWPGSDSASWMWATSEEGAISSGGVLRSVWSSLDPGADPLILELPASGGGVSPIWRAGQGAVAFPFPVGSIWRSVASEMQIEAAGLAESLDTRVRSRLPGPMEILRPELASSLAWAYQEAPSPGLERLIWLSELSGILYGSGITAAAAKSTSRAPQDRLTAVLGELAWSVRSGSPEADHPKTAALPAIIGNWSAVSRSRDSGKDPIVRIVVADVVGAGPIRAILAGGSVVLLPMSSLRGLSRMNDVLSVLQGRERGPEMLVVLFSPPGALVELSSGCSALWSLAVTGRVTLLPLWTPWEPCLGDSGSGAGVQSSPESVSPGARTWMLGGSGSGQG